MIKANLVFIYTHTFMNPSVEVNAFPDIVIYYAFEVFHEAVHIFSGCE